MTDSPPDPAGTDEPHDVLAAEEFAIPRPEPGVPHDLDPEAHDVLAAEEFPFPSPEDKASLAGRSGSLPWVAAGAALAGAFAWLRGRSRRSRRRRRLR